eukprot:4620750-Pleurochrysis_carterae.AAC.2
MARHTSASFRNSANVHATGARSAPTLARVGTERKRFSGDSSTRGTNLKCGNDTSSRKTGYCDLADADLTPTKSRKCLSIVQIQGCASRIVSRRRKKGNQGGRDHTSIRGRKTTREEAELTEQETNATLLMRAGANMKVGHCKHPTDECANECASSHAKCANVRHCGRFSGRLPCGFKSAKAKPGASARERTEVSARVNAGVSARVKPGVSARVKSDVSARVKPSVSKRVKPGVSAKVKPGVSAKVKPGVSARVKPSVSKRVKPGVSARVKPGVSAKVKPGVSARVKPGVSARVKP